MIVWRLDAFVRIDVDTRRDIPALQIHPLRCRCDQWRRSDATRGSDVSPCAASDKISWSSARSKSPCEVDLFPSEAALASSVGRFTFRHTAYASDRTSAPLSAPAGSRQRMASLGRTLPQLVDNGVSTGVFNARIVSLRFFFGVTFGREEMK